MCLVGNGGIGWWFIDVNSFHGYRTRHCFAVPSCLTVRDMGNCTAFPTTSTSKTVKIGSEEYILFIIIIYILSYIYNIIWVSPELAGSMNLRIGTHQVGGSHDPDPQMPVPMENSQWKLWLTGIPLCHGAIENSPATWGNYPKIDNWLVVDLPLWKIWKSLGMMTFPIYGKIKNVPNHRPDHQMIAGVLKCLNYKNSSCPFRLSSLSALLLIRVDQLHFRGLSEWKVSLD